MATFFYGWRKLRRFLFVSTSEPFHEKKQGDEEDIGMVAQRFAIEGQQDLGAGSQGG
jgi:hypothetical protein